MQTIGACFWKIEKIVSKGDYNYAVVREHPNASKHGYVLEHRIVVENRLNRLLGPDEVVHHVNGKKKDNRDENLEVLLLSEHTREHTRTRGRKWVTLKCPTCFTIFDRPKNQSFLNKNTQYTCCSMRCRGLLTSKIQHHGLTEAVESAISGNLVREYRKYYHDNPEETV